MKFIKKIKERIYFIITIIRRKRFVFSDVFYLFSVKSSLKKKKRREEVELLTGSSIFLEEKSNGKDATLFFGDLKIDIPFFSKATREEIISSIVDFVVPLVRRSIGEEEPYIFNKINEGPYEIEGCFLKEGDFVIDAGGNIGLFSVFASKVVKDNGKIFTFEPVSTIYKTLQRNIEVNNISNCVVFRYALGSFNGEVDIFIDEKKIGASTLRANNEATSKEKIKQIKLDDFVKQNNIPKIDFIKADIEGAERCLIEGGRETIKKHKPNIAICTYHLEDDKEVIEGLLKNIVPEYKIIHKYKKLYASVKSNNINNEYFTL